jgi:NADP-dependent 3-hydroxy acid dehydrogenase YdfG
MSDFLALGRPLTGTSALVTGASSGIGWATAELLAALGARMTLVARRAERIEELAGQIISAGGEAIAVPADVTDADQARGCVEQASRHWGSLDIVVNNAGLLMAGPVESAPLDEFDQMIDVNVRGLLYVSRAALAPLLDAARESARGVSDLVNVSSVSGRRANAGSAVYNASKFAVTGFSECLRQEVTRRHVRVSVIEPGAVVTELPTHMRQEIRETPNPEFSGFTYLEAVDVAETIAFTVTRPRRVCVNEVMVRPTEQLA